MNKLFDLLEKLSIFGAIILFVVIVFFPIATVSVLYQYGTADTARITVTDKERVCDKDDCKWLVFTSNNGVYQNSDAFFHFKFDSADVQASLVPGNSYFVDYYGWRIPFLSMYPNIVEVN